MPNPLSRIVAFLLVPCLMADPAFASALFMNSPFSGRSENSLFTRQALMPRGLEEGAVIAGPATPKIESIETQSASREWTNPYEWLSFAPWEEVRPHLPLNGSTTDLVLELRKVGGVTSHVEFTLKSFKIIHKDNLEMIEKTLAKRLGFFRGHFIGNLPDFPLIEDLLRLQNTAEISGFKLLTVASYKRYTPGCTTEESQSQIQKLTNAGLLHYIGDGFIVTPKGILLRTILHTKKTAEESKAASKTAWRPPTLIPKTIVGPKPVISQDRSEEKLLRASLLQLAENLSCTPYALAHALVEMLPTLVTKVRQLYQVLYNQPARHIFESDIIQLKDFIAGDGAELLLKQAIEKREQTGIQTKKITLQMIAFKIPAYYVLAIVKSSAASKTVKDLIAFVPSGFKDGRLPNNAKRLFQKGTLADGYQAAILFPSKEIQIVKMTAPLHENNQYVIIRIPKPDVEEPLPEGPLTAREDEFERRSEMRLQDVRAPVVSLWRSQFAAASADLLRHWPEVSRETGNKVEAAFQELADELSTGINPQDRSVLSASQQVALQTTALIFVQMLGAMLSGVPPPGTIIEKNGEDTFGRALHIRQMTAAGLLRITVRFRLDEEHMPLLTFNTFRLNATGSDTALAQIRLGLDKTGNYGVHLDEVLLGLTPEDPRIHVIHSFFITAWGEGRTLAAIHAFREWVALLETQIRPWTLTSKISVDSSLLTPREKNAKYTQNVILPIVRDLNSPLWELAVGNLRRLAAWNKNQPDHSAIRYRIITKTLVLTLMHPAEEVRKHAWNLLLELIAEAGDWVVDYPGTNNLTTAIDLVFRKVLAWIAMPWGSNGSYILETFEKIWPGVTAPLTTPQRQGRRLRAGRVYSLEIAKLAGDLGLQRILLERLKTFPEMLRRNLSEMTDVDREFLEQLHAAV
jgi:hypothetical protein